MQISDFITKHSRSPVWFNNKKTEIAVDFQICPLMGKKDNSITSPKCKGCYSANILNIYTQLRNKIENIPSKFSQSDLNDFENDLKDMLDGNLLTLDDNGEYKLRFFALSDFVPASMSFIKIASQYLTVDILSKTLTMKHNEKYLKELINMPNVWVSLSFNKDWLSNLNRIKSLIEKTKAQNVQLNYTMNVNEENLNDPFFDQFQVFHFKNKKLGQRTVAERFNISESRTCGVYDWLGRKVKGNGSCVKCNNCHISYLDYLKGKEVSLPKRSTIAV